MADNPGEQAAQHVSCQCTDSYVSFGFLSHDKSLSDSLRQHALPVNNIEPHQFPPRDLLPKVGLVVPS